MGTIINGILEYDEDKNRRNIETRGLSFDLAERVLADHNVVTRLDDRKNYGETRYIVYGLVEGRRLSLCWTRRGYKVRVISLRYVHLKEWEKYYGKNYR